MQPNIQRSQSFIVFCSLLFVISTRTFSLNHFIIFKIFSGLTTRTDYPERRTNCQTTTWKLSLPINITLFFDGLLFTLLQQCFTIHTISSRNKWNSSLTNVWKYPKRLHLNFGYAKSKRSKALEMFNAIFFKVTIKSQFDRNKDTRNHYVRKWTKAFNFIRCEKIEATSKMVLNS